MRLWDEFLRTQEVNLGRSVVQKWLRPLELVHFDACNLYLEAKDPCQVIWFEEHIRPILKTGFLNENHKAIKVHLTLPGTPLKSSEKKKPAPIPWQWIQDPLDEKMGLDRFLEGKNNELILRFFQQELHSSTVSFNPVYLWGAHGCGKTHLLMALAQSYQAQGKKALYAKAMTFAENFVNAIRASQMKEFRKAYRDVDLLLIDDVHHFARKNATQEEFFHTFNTLHTAGKQIILSASCAPQQLKEIESRLISRFEWGINFHFEMMEHQQLAHVFRQRTEMLHFPLSQDVENHFLKTFSTFSSLESALEALILRCHLQNDARYKRNSLLLTPPLVESLLEDLIQKQHTEQLTSEKILTHVSHYFGIQPEDLVGKAQTKEYALARHLAIYLCRTRLRLSLMAIGKIFHRDHSTILTSIRQIERRKEALDPEILTFFQEISIVE